MMQEILKEGKLAQKLMQISAAKMSGVLSIEYQNVRKVICLEDGIIRYATSNIKNEWFLEYLIGSGIIDKAKTTGFMSEPAISDRTAQLLSSAGLISEEIAVVEAHNLILKIVRSCFKAQGRVQFTEGHADLRGKITTNIDPREAVLEYYRQQAAIPECRTVAGKENLIVCIAPSAEETVKGLGLNNAEKNILKLIDGVSSIRVITQICPAPPEQTARNLAILKIMGIIETKDINLAKQKIAESDAKKPSTETPAEKDAAEYDEEKRYYYELYERHIRSNYFQILGVQRSSSGDEIRAHYYSLAKELHPDRFQKESMKDIHPLMESLFARICEAYNTLLDKEARKKYEAVIFGEAETFSSTGNEKLDKNTLARGNFYRGKKLFEEGKYNEALKFLENAVSLDPTRWEYYLQLGLTQSKNPRMRTEAIFSFKKVIVMNPTSAEAYLELGILYKKCGKITEAKNMLRSALQWEPDNALAAYELKEVEKGA